MHEIVDSTLQILSTTVNHYLKHNFTGLRLEGEDKVNYIWENGLHLNLGRNVDHMEYCMWLAANAPYYGVLVKDFATLTGLKQYYRIGLGKHTEVPKTVQLTFLNLPKTTSVLVLADCSKWKSPKIKRALRNWDSTKPTLFLG